MVHAGVMRRLPQAFAATAALAAGGILVGRVLGYKLGPHAVVRCRSGHVFETAWYPGVKLNRLDFVVARVQRCPVGNHLSVVVPIRTKDLSVADRRAASSRRA
jgi:hypothetical protein